MDERTGEWISVKKRLPEDQKRVFVHIKLGDDVIMLVAFHSGSAMDDWYFPSHYHENPVPLYEYCAEVDVSSAPPRFPEVVEWRLL
jgi:hypothetical protein